MHKLHFLKSLANLFTILSVVFFFLIEIEVIHLSNITVAYFFLLYNMLDEFPHVSKNSSKVI